MTMLGLSSKREITRTSVRVRVAIAAQVRDRAAVPGECAQLLAGGRVGPTAELFAALSPASRGRARACLTATDRTAQSSQARGRCRARRVV